MGFHVLLTTLRVPEDNVPGQHDLAGPHRPSLSPRTNQHLLHMRAESNREHRTVWGEGEERSSVKTCPCQGRLMLSEGVEEKMSSCCLAIKPLSSDQIAVKWLVMWIFLFHCSAETGVYFLLEFTFLKSLSEGPFVVSEVKGSFRFSLKQTTWIFSL